MNTELLYKYLSGRTTVDEENAIGRWLAQDPETNQKEIDAVRVVFEAATLYGDRAGRCRTRLLPPPSRARRAVRNVLRVAAVAALAVAAWWWYRVNTEVYDAQQSIYVPAGQRMELTLSDGTHIWLNADTKIEYPPVFGRGERRIKLCGEAYFEVAHDASRPFRVETYASEIEVLGTKFNVNADVQNARFSTTLIEGSVRLTNLLDKNRQQVIMKPNQQVSMVNDMLVFDSRPNIEDLCWTEGYINIANVPFDQLMERFEKTFNVRIVIARDTLPDVGYVSGHIRTSENIRFALALLQRACRFTYVIDEVTNTVTIM